MNHQYIFLYFLLFPVFWIIGCKLFSILGGLSSKPDLTDFGPLDSTLHMCSGKIGSLRINAAMNIDIYKNGISLRMLWLFGGAQLPIKYSEVVNSYTKKNFISDSLIIELRNGRTIQISGSAAEILQSKLT